MNTVIGTDAEVHSDCDHNEKILIPLDLRNQIYQLDLMFFFNKLVDHFQSLKLEAINREGRRNLVQPCSHQPSKESLVDCMLIHWEQGKLLVVFPKKYDGFI
ncbi:hypothetical protein [Cellvibrio polysaccharolyticus]|nr:hypothetical protein [Cellvibrio polysaccharolyticus]